MISRPPVCQNKISNRLQPSTGQEESIGILSFHIGPSGSEELSVFFKGFTFIVIGEGDDSKDDSRSIPQKV